MDVERQSHVGHRSRTWLLVGLIAASTLACSKQGEGGRCDLLSGNDDCESGLMCVSLADRNQGVGAVCCPSEGDSDNPICKGNSVDLTGGDAGSQPSESDAQTTALDAGDASPILTDAGADSDASAVEAGGPDATVTDSSVGASSAASDTATESSSSDVLSSDLSTDVSTLDSSSATDTASSATDTATGTSTGSSEADAGDAG